MSFICAVRVARAAAGISSPSQPLVLLRRLLRENDEPSSVSRDGDCTNTSDTSAVAPVVTICAVSGGSTDSKRLCTWGSTISACQSHRTGRHRAGSKRTDVDETHRKKRTSVEIQYVR